MGNDDAQTLTWDVVNLGESEPRESIPLRELDLMPISHDVVDLKGNSTFSSCSFWKKFLKRFSGYTKECATEDQTFNHNLLNILIFNCKIDELGLVEKCVEHSFSLYMGCYLQFCITKKLRPVNKNSSKVHFFHILSAHAKGLITPTHTLASNYSPNPNPHTLK